ncbi:hypothetical protein G4B88_019614 [Cannabis sativa]|uniref:Uncharacterized protein n=1 Tax=Cannabis sativa TaxID=3483 RepID=A0A7J6HRJ4_CANSA|nr:hypothetical protein G4B88_019614 [Cannabis sativa]
MVDEAGSLKSMKPRIHIQSDNNKSGAFKFERHGDLLNKYLYLSGRVDMRQIEKTIQYLIGSGMDRRTENNPYLNFICTQFQERATFISHGNTARLAKEHGDLKLAQICGTIATHEKRHETTYTKIVEKLFEIDHIVKASLFVYENFVEKLFRILKIYMIMNYTQVSC